MTAFEMHTLESKLLNNYQRHFPLCPRPFLAIADELGATEDRVTSALANLQARGVVSRIGATIVPGRLGAATLAAELYAAAHGADFIRTHDPAALRDALAVTKALGRVAL